MQFIYPFIPFHFDRKPILRNPSGSVELATIYLEVTHPP